jgi:hypothetical protein
MSEPFDLWGQRGWASVEVVGESHYAAAIRALFPAGVTAAGTDLKITVRLLPEPLNKHDRNAVGVWSGERRIGHLSRADAARYSPVLSVLVARGRVPQVQARVWAADSRDRGGFVGSVQLELAEPHLLVPANRPPGDPHRMLPPGAAIQVTGEDKHLDTLVPWLRPEGECWVHATLHELVEKSARSERSVVEVRIDGARIGQLSPRMSGDLLAAVRHLAEQGQTAGVRAIVKGNRIKAEVVLYTARAHELPDSWLAPEPQVLRPVLTPSPAARSVPVAVPAFPPRPAAESRSASPAPPVIEGRSSIPVPQPQPQPQPPQVDAVRFNPPPNWPAPPAGWRPAPGWTPDPGWGPPPPGWQLWITGPVPVPRTAPPPVVPPPAADVDDRGIPLFGARGKARELATEVAHLRAENARLQAEIDSLGLNEMRQLEERRRQLSREIAEQVVRSEAERAEMGRRLDELRRQVVVTEDLAMLQELGIYRYQHPLSDSVAYQEALNVLQEQIKEMARADGGAVRAAAGWTVNGSEAQGRTMLRDYSKLMLRAYNAEADNLVRTLKPYRLEASIDRLGKVAATIARLGKTMDIRITDEYHRLRVRELGLTADHLEKLAEEKEREREEKARLREERRLQQEIEREKARLDKERQHYANALAAMRAQGDIRAAAQLEERLAEIDTAIQDVDYRAANVRAGYVYVISNLGAFGENMIKVGMTRRLDPMERVRELGDASVPFGFDVHALFFADDAVGIEAQMHARLADRRVNLVNQRREFFYATPAEAKQHLTELTGSLLQYEETAEALEYRQSRKAAV